MWKDIRIGFQSWAKSWSYISEHRLWYYFLYPIALSILMGMGIYAFVDEAVELISQRIFPEIQSRTGDDSAWSMIVAMMFQVSKLILYILLFYTMWRVNKYLMLALMSPLLSLLVSRILKIETGVESAFQWKAFLHGIWRGSLMAIRNLVLELSLVYLLWIIDLGVSFFLPPAAIIISPICLVASFLISAYFYGLSMLDYSLEQQGFSALKSSRWIWKHKGLALSNGFVFSLLFSLPFFGTTLSTISCAVGATLARLKAEKRDAAITL
jgi:CysZ protein